MGLFTYLKNWKKKQQQRKTAKKDLVLHLGNHRKLIGVYFQKKNGKKSLSTEAGACPDALIRIKCEFNLPAVFGCKERIGQRSG